MSEEELRQDAVRRRLAGESPTEIAEALRLPPSLEHTWAARGYYGTRAEAIEVDAAQHRRGAVELQQLANGVQAPVQRDAREHDGRQLGDDEHQRLAAGAHALQQVQHVGAAGACRDYRVDRGAVEQRADAVAVARQQPRQHGDELARDAAPARSGPAASATASASCSSRRLVNT